MSVTLNEDQQAAEDAILAAYDRGETEFLLEGSAGCGKTVVVQSVCGKLSNRKARNRNGYTQVCASAPTHKAAQVIGRKLDEAGLDHIERMTIHSFLGLKPTISDSERQVLARNPAGISQIGSFDVLAIDEASMVGKDLQRFIDNDLTMHFVIYVGDEAQLPPVGEEHAPCFDKVPKRNRYKLTKIVRQAEGNPILAAATVLRDQQKQSSGKIDWSWTAQAVNEETNQGLYHCSNHVDAWLYEAFTSGKFKDNNDAYRYIAYTNYRVKEVNNKIRKWIYGDTPTPFVVGERVMCRNPILNESQAVMFSTNEEAIVTSISLDVKSFYFSRLFAASGQRDIPEWQANIEVWRIGLQSLEGNLSETRCVATMVKNEYKYKDMERKLVSEAKGNRNRWREYFDTKEQLADIRLVYAMTAHSSQGSTFGVAFVDVPDIAKRQKDNVLECQKLFYVALTRASQGVVLVGV